MRRDWRLMSSKDRPFTVTLVEAPSWVWTVDIIFQWVEEKILRHSLCNPPEWTWHVPTTSLRKEEGDGWWEYEKSLGSRMYALLNIEGNWVWSKEKEWARVDIPKETYHEISASAGDMMSWFADLSEEVAAGEQLTPDN